MYIYIYTHIFMHIGCMVADIAIIAHALPSQTPSATRDFSRPHREDYDSEWSSWCLKGPWRHMTTLPNWGKSSHHSNCSSIFRVIRVLIWRRACVHNIYIYIYIFAQPNNLNLNKQLDMTLGDRSTDFGQSLRSPCTDLKRTHPGKKTKISYLDRLSVFNTPKTTRVHRSGRNANAVRHVIDAPH